MEYYVGLDVSLKQTSICVVDQTGSVVREGVVDSDPEAISVYVRSKAPGAVRIGLETGPTSTWLWTELKRTRPQPSEKLRIRKAECRCLKRAATHRRTAPAQNARGWRSATRTARQMQPRSPGPPGAHG